MTPSRRLIALFSLAALVFLVPVASAPWGGLGWSELWFERGGWLLNLAVLALALVDASLSAKLSKIGVEREAGDVMSVGARNLVRLWLTNRNLGAVKLSLHDEYPLPATVEGLPFDMELEPRQARSRGYHLVPHLRGMNRFGRITLRMRSWLGLWWFHDQRLLDTPVKIYPDIQAVHGLELLARRNRTAELGVRLSRLRGRGSDFDRLREYRQGDEPRHIDWKATARQGQLISREYVVERNQNILVVIDCGRSMANSSDGVSHLDRAINAAIMLTHVAIRQGDNVGLMAAGGKTERWLRPMRGSAAMQSMIRSLYDLEPRYEATDYPQLVEQVRLRFRKRSLVVFLTHALDDLHLKSISKHARELQNPHLVLTAFLRDVPLEQRVRQIPRGDLDAIQIGSAAQLLLTQTQMIQKLAATGMLAIDVLPSQLTSEIVTRYLEINARHLL
ncbi:MAG: DUF58 domain-containing protein [Planctomycetaceae bacterium]